MKLPVCTIYKGLTHWHLPVIGLKQGTVVGMLCTILNLVCFICLFLCYSAPDVGRNERQHQ